jgi:hypothetical protein
MSLVSLETEEECVVVTLIVDSGGAEQCSEYCGMLIESTRPYRDESPSTSRPDRIHR